MLSRTHIFHPEYSDGLVKGRGDEFPAGGGVVEVREGRRVAHVGAQDAVLAVHVPNVESVSAAHEKKKIMKIMKKNSEKNGKKYSYVENKNKIMKKIC